MTSYLGPVPAIPTLSPTNIYPEDVQPLEVQIDQVYTDIAFVVNDKARANQYLLQEDITNDDWVTSTANSPIPIYTITLPTGALVNGINNIPHGILGFDTLVDIRVMVSNGTNQRMIPYSSPTAINSASIDVDNTNVILTLGVGFGAGYSGWIIMQYTRT